MNYEWDSGKAKSNYKKHGVTFDEAGSIFLDPLAMSGHDPDHSEDETRFITLGLSSLGRYLVVSHTYRPGAVRLISARLMTRKERQLYEEG